MDRRQISSGAAFEDRVGYSRAVVANGYVHVSGTAPIMPGDADPPDDAYAQAKRCLEIVVDALRRGGSGPEHVVRTRIHVTDVRDSEEVARGPAEASGSARPAATGVVVEVLDPRWRVEIEAGALVP